jgi:HEAT repeat protein
MAKDGKSTERLEAIERLGDMGSSESLQDLASILQDDSDSNVRTRCALSLGRLGDPDSIRPLAQALLHDPQVTVRVSAAQALDMIGFEAVEGPLLQATDRSQPVEVRVEALRALGSVHTKRSFEALTAALKDETEAVRLAALESFARRGDPRASVAVRELLDDRNELIVQKACWTLGELRDKSSVSALTVTLRGAHANATRLQSALALGRIGDLKSLEALSASSLADTEDLTVRVAAVRALGMLNSLEAGPPLVRLLKHHEAILRSAAANSLCSLPTPDAASGVKELVHDPDARVRVAAIIAMGLWPEYFSAALVAVAQDRSQLVDARILALSALSDLPANRLRDVDLKRLLDPKESIELQIAGVRFLTTSDTPGAQSALKEFRKIETLDPRVREALSEP